MFLHLPIAILATFSPIVVSDTVPKFDTVRECRIEGGPSVDQARCSRDEAAALRQLQDAWAQYAGADRKSCTAETTTGDFASYVELLTCLEIARDAEGQGVIAEGHVEPGGTFTAETVLAKHDENYMPREVVDTIKKQGHWQETSAPVKQSAR
jgi:hypothetical protein